MQVWVRMTANANPHLSPPIRPLVAWPDGFSLATQGHPRATVGPPYGPWRQHPSARTSGGSVLGSEFDLRHRSRSPSRGDLAVFVAGHSEQSRKHASPPRAAFHNIESGQAREGGETRWENLPLDPQHVDKLKSSGISPLTAGLRGYETVHDPRRLDALGFAKEVCHPDHAPGLPIPQLDARGSVWGYQYRPDNPRTNAKGKPIKYESQTRGEGRRMRIAQARQLFDDDVVAGRRYGAASKRPNFRQHLERRSESGDLGENLLGSADHLPVLDVVCGLVPRADESPVLDRSARQVCAQMSTPPRDREVVAVDVSNGIRSRTGHRPRGHLGNWAYCDLLCHASLQSPPTVLNTSLSTYPRPHAGKHLSPSEPQMQQIH